MIRNNLRFYHIVFLKFLLNFWINLDFLNKDGLTYLKYDKWWELMLANVFDTMKNLLFMDFFVTDGDFFDILEFLMVLRAEDHMSWDWIFVKIDFLKDI